MIGHLCGQQLERGGVHAEAGVQGGRDQPGRSPRPRHQGLHSNPVGSRTLFLVPELFVPDPDPGTNERRKNQLNNHNFTYFLISLYRKYIKMLIKVN